MFFKVGSKSYCNGLPEQYNFVSIGGRLSSVAIRLPTQSNFIIVGRRLSKLVSLL